MCESELGGAYGVPGQGTTRHTRIASATSATGMSATKIDKRRPSRASSIDATTQFPRARQMRYSLPNNRRPQIGRHAPRVRAAIAVSLMRRPMHCDGRCNLP